MWAFAGWVIKDGALPLPYPCVLPVAPIGTEYLPHPSPLQVRLNVHFPVGTIRVSFNTVT